MATDESGAVHREEAQHGPSDDRAGRMKVVPETASDYVTGELRTGILAGRYALGSRLDQQALANQMGVSTIPVREGLRRLEAEGLVRIYPRRGAFVAEVSVEELQELNRIREVLEDLAARLAAPNLGSGQLAELAAITERMSAATKESDVAVWVDLNREFHFKLYAAAGSPVLLQLIGALRDRTSLYRLVNASRADHRSKSNLEHREMLLHLAARDGKRLGREIVSHIRRSEKDLLRPAPKRPGGPDVTDGKDE